MAKTIGLTFPKGKKPEKDKNPEAGKEQKPEKDKNPEAGKEQKPEK